MSSEIRNCIPPDRDLETPGIKLLAGSVDTYMHVFEDNYP